MPGVRVMVTARIPGLHDRAPLRPDLAVEWTDRLNGGIPGLHDRAPLRPSAFVRRDTVPEFVFPVFMTGLH